ncbi:C6 zinc finger protein [Ophiocordyceps camponoti-floridani]|uniref:C6 zinc finger protein n=1 Tax=Ophiocordyceps camponoti-floridani TaxID=2030778 RepID=A0A8H4Q475_9HYPO|nr:C6 zinc finger protein [Ophiocordyceps camponoti-floridani]
MPPRRSHRKSRAGCRRCKSRKIKCDEVHPRCGNCVKHGVLCDFENNSVPPRKPVVAPSPVPSPGLSPEPVSIDRLLELRLLHHFTVSTANTLFFRPSSPDHVWQRAVPLLAFQQGWPYLMDAILSVAALHLRTLSPDDNVLARASITYSSTCLTAYCSAVERGITAANAEALFLTATLIAFRSAASRLFLKDDSDPDAAPDNTRYVLPMAWFHAFQSFKSIISTSWHWIQDSQVVKAVIDSQPTWKQDSTPLEDDSFFAHLLDGLDQELAEEPPQQVSATTQGYFYAVGVLDWAHKSAYAPAALAFPAGVSGRFVELIEEKRPRALVILACFYALLKRVQGVWWLNDVARREVAGITGLFDPASAWRRHLEWPIRVSVWEGSDVPSDIWGVECDDQPPEERRLVESLVNHMELLSKQAAKNSSLAVDGNSGLNTATLD